MANGAALVRKSYFVDSKQMLQITKLMKVKSEAEAIRKLVAEFVEQARFWKFLEKTAGKLRKRSFRT